jgi:hypothetical protein
MKTIKARTFENAIVKSITDKAIGVTKGGRGANFKGRAAQKLSAHNKKSCHNLSNFGK